MQIPQEWQLLAGDSVSEMPWNGSFYLLVYVHLSAESLILVILF